MKKKEIFEIVVVNLLKSIFYQKKEFWAFQLKNCFALKVAAWFSTQSYATFGCLLHFQMK